MKNLNVGIPIVYGAGCLSNEILPGQIQRINFSGKIWWQCFRLGIFLLKWMLRPYATNAYIIT